MNSAEIGDKPVTDFKIHHQYRLSYGVLTIQKFMLIQNIEDYGQLREDV